MLGTNKNLDAIIKANKGDLMATVMSFSKALSTLDDFSRQQALEQVFGKFQFARLSALFENLGKEGSQTLQVLDLMKASTGDLATVADRELAQVTESASCRYRRAV